MDISIVVCTHNRAKLLSHTLEALRAADLPENFQAEVLVVANACKDETISLLASLSGQWRQSGLGLRWLEEPKPGKSNALNLAIQEAKADVLCFIDDDQVVARDYLLALADLLARQPEFGMYCGWMLPAWDGSEPAWIHVRGEFMIPIRPFPEYDLGDTEKEIVAGMKSPSGGNIVVRREVFEHVGGFSTELGPIGHNLMGGEDLEFIRRAKAAGTRLLYSPRMRQFHLLEYERMKTLYMMRKSYLRSFSSVTMRRQDGGANIALSLLRKLASHLLRVCTSLDSSRRFYWLMRFAAAMGELRGQFQPKPD